MKMSVFTFVIIFDIKTIFYDYMTVYLYRFDVLATLVEYATDLTERQCVQIFAHFMLAPASDLVSPSF